MRIALLVAIAFGHTAALAQSGPPDIMLGSLREGSAVRLLGNMSFSRPHQNVFLGAGTFPGGPRGKVRVECYIYPEEYPTLTSQGFMVDSFYITYRVDSVRMIRGESPAVSVRLVHDVRLASESGERERQVLLLQCEGLETFRTSMLYELIGRGSTRDEYRRPPATVVPIFGDSSAQSACANMRAPNMSRFLTSLRAQGKCFPNEVYGSGASDDEDEEDASSAE